MREVFPDNDLYVIDYMLSTLSSCLDGRNSAETLSFWTGLSSKQTGGNVMGGTGRCFTKRLL